MKIEYKGTIQVFFFGLEGIKPVMVDRLAAKTATQLQYYDNRVIGQRKFSYLEFRPTEEEAKKALLEYIDKEIRKIERKKERLLTIAKNYQ